MTAFVVVAACAGVVALVPTRVRPAVWMLVIAAGVTPWSSWAGQARWDRVEWMPFSAVIRPRDITLNVFLYVPLGCFVSSAWRGSRSARLVAAVVCGVLFSALTEVTQVFSLRRFPGTTDVVTNTIGAVVGAALAGWQRPAVRVRESS